MKQAFRPPLHGRRLWRPRCIRDVGNGSLPASIRLAQQLPRFVPRVGPVGTVPPIHVRDQRRMPIANSGLRRGIRRLMGKPPHSGEADVDRRRSKILLFQEEPVSKYHGEIEREARFRTVLPDELIDSGT